MSEQCCCKFIALAWGTSVPMKILVCVPILVILESNGERAGNMND